MTPPIAKLPATWTFTLLAHPPRRTRCRGLGFWQGHPFGSAEGQRGSQPTVFIWDQEVPTEIEAKNCRAPHPASGVSEAQAAGWGDVKDQMHAMLFSRTASGVTATDLHSATFWRTGAVGLTDGRQYGYGLKKGVGHSFALSWAGSPDTCTELPALGEWKDCEVRGVGDGIAVGKAGGPGVARACFWRNEGDPIDLHPEGSYLSECVAAADGEQVGSVWKDMDRTDPVRWTGSAGSAVFLTPQGMQGGGCSSCAQGFQAGWADVDKSRQLRHAIIWAGNPDAFIDLHQFVKADPWNVSAIHAIRIHDGTITAIGEVGEVVDGKHPQVRAALWTARLT